MREIEKNLKAMEFDGMEGHGSAIVDDPVEVGNFQLHLGDGQFMMWSSSTGDGGDCGLEAASPLGGVSYSSQPGLAGL